MLRTSARPSSPTATAARSASASVVAVSGGILVLHSALVAAGISEVGTLAVNLGFVALLLVLAASAGFDRWSLGLCLTSRGAVIAGVAGAATALAVVVVPHVVRLPADAAILSLAPGQVWFRAAVAIPLGTAVCEEVIFRGVLLAACDRLLARGWSVVATSAAFGLWHVAAEAARSGGIGASVLPGVAATAAVSALVLCPLRRRSDSLLAPITVHAVANVGIFLAVHAIAS